MSAVLKMPPMKAHAIKIEDLEMGRSYADAIVEELTDFALELGYSKDRLDELDCRSRDGFSPYSHNKGGIGAIAYVDQYNAECEGTGFDNCDATLKKYADYDLESFLEKEGVTEMDYDNDDMRERFDEYRRSDDDATVLFGLDMMLLSDTELNLRFTVCAKDSPYHRKFDDLISIDISFKSIAGLKQKLARVLKRQDVKTFSSNLNEAY